MINVTRILNAVAQGDTRAADRLLTILYSELRSLATQLLSRERPGQTCGGCCFWHSFIFCEARDPPFTH